MREWAAWSRSSWVWAAMGSVPLSGVNEVVPLSGLPFVVGFGQDGSDEADHGGVVREDPYDD